MEEISQDYCVCAYNLSHTRTQQFARNALLYTAVPLGEITYTFANRNESVIRCPAVFEEQHRAELTAYRAAAAYPAILACWNSEKGQRKFAAQQAEQAHLAGREKQEVPVGELPAVHIAVVCGLNRKFYKQRNSQRPICDMQFTVVINESNRELRWQGASYSGAHLIFVAIFTIT